MTTFVAAELISADVLAGHLQEIIVEYESYKKQFRRTDKREPVSIPVEAVALDEDLVAISDAIHMVTRDMSAGGCGIFHDQRLDCPYLHLNFSSPVSLATFSVVASLEHCTPCGKYFIVGCRFLTNQSES